MSVYRYDEIRIIRVGCLVYGRNEGTTKNLCDKIDGRVDAYANGDLRHAADAVALLWEVSKKRRHTAPIPGAASTFVRLTYLAPSCH